jgi:uncharacterized protein YndB with AHSA1/START domain
MENTKIQALPGKQEIIITSTYPAARDIVYRTMTDPRLIPEWWGPRNLTNEVEKYDVRPGGQWRIIQGDPQGNIFAFHGVFHEVRPPERLVYTFEWDGMPGHVLLDIKNFEGRNGLTTCTLQGIFETVEDRDGMLQQGMESGNQEMTDRLTELLTKISQGVVQPAMQAQLFNGGSLKIARVINAPVRQVWKYWTDPNAYLCWSAPKDYFGCDYQTDFRVGGKYLSCIQGPDGKKIWSTGIYKEIREPNRFVCTDSFADEQGNIVPASFYGMEGEFPLELEVEVNLEDLGEKTRLTLEHCGFPNAMMIEQTKQGWNESFDKLEQCLE